MIQVRHIRKAFKDLTVLDGIDLEIKSGEVTAIIGRQAQENQRSSVV